MNREFAISRLKKKSFDLLIIGGGATGCGIALEAATRGLTVALVEKNDFSSGTSSRSTKLIHGGVRYLELAVKNLDKEQYKLVKESLQERAILLKIAPHLVKPISLVTPLYRWTETPYYRLGLRMYDWIAGQSGLQKSHFLSSKESLELFPHLKRKGLRGGIVYYDGQFNDARMNITLAMTADLNGAVLANHVEALQFLYKNGKIVGATLQDLLSPHSAPWDVEAKICINATGPFSDQIRSLDRPSIPPLLELSIGSHIVLPAFYSPPDTGLLIPKTEDGRVLFLLPWQRATLVGTTDLPCTLSFQPKPSPFEMEYILRQLSQYFSFEIKSSEIQSSWAGIRPLVKADALLEMQKRMGKNKEKTKLLVRDHYIEVSPSGLVTICGGKWTTYRKMAIDTVEVAIRRGNLSTTRNSHTHQLLLHGARHYKPELVQEIQAAHSLSERTAYHLVHSYGDQVFLILEMAKQGYEKLLHPAYPFLEAEIVYGIRYESARTKEDLLSRRLRFSFLDQKASQECEGRVQEILEKELS